MTCVLSCFSSCSVCFIFFFFFNDTATTEIYTLSLHDALPILATSMFWFPAPAEPSPAVEEMLGAERKYLTANWTLWKIFLALLVPALFAALGLAFWKRSLGWGMAVINAAVLIKVGWTFVFGTEAGAMAHLPAALLGLAACDALVLYAMQIGRASCRERV